MVEKHKHPDSGAEQMTDEELFDLDEKRRLSHVYYGIAFVFFLLLVGTVSMHYLENWSFIDSAYFSTVTLTTVGYGDLVPQHETTRLFLIVYILGGVSSVLYVLTSVGRYYFERRMRKDQEMFKKLRASARELAHSGKHFRIPPPPTMRK